ncbi:MAG: hypothetical protein Q8S84_03420 [bacterium]|nr:hypothetical protein [bacterium]MDP3380575.1 hypothetical protein [bacterium]
MYAKFGTTLLEVLSDSSNNTHESNRIVNDLMKNTIFDCFTTYQNIGIFVNILANHIFHTYVEFIILITNTNHITHKISFR